uniref:Uncharacterized protein n=1 Tax=Arundo donax TaxID=35708 RepID=A0A0A9DG68_ARUDO
MRSYPYIILWRYSNFSSLYLQTPPMSGLVYPYLSLHYPRTCCLNTAYVVST